MDTILKIHSYLSNTTKRILRLVKRITILLLSFIHNIIFFSTTLTINNKKNNKIFIIGLVEHMGDIIACEPIIRYLKNNNDSNKIYWITRKSYKFLLEKHQSIEKCITVSCLSEWITLKSILKNYEIIDLHFNKKQCHWFGIRINNKNLHEIDTYNYYDNNRTLLHAFCLSGNIEHITETPNIGHLIRNIKFNWEEKIKNRFIVIHAKSNEEERNWGNENFNKLVELILKESKLSVIEIGIDNAITFNNDRIYNYCGKLSVQESVNLLNQAILFIGVDSVFAHIAYALSVPHIILLGKYRNFDHYIPFITNPSSNNYELMLQSEGCIKNLSHTRVAEASIAMLKKISS